LRFTRSRDDLTRWQSGADPVVGLPLAARLHEVLTTGELLTGVYDSPEDSGRRTYWCLIASRGWLHEITADMEHLAVTRSSHRLTEIKSVNVESAGLSADQRARIRSMTMLMQDGSTKEWEWELSSRDILSEVNPLLEFVSDLVTGRVEG
jgi:hypothetical protein